MSLSFSNQKGVEGKHLGPIKIGTVDITFDNSYVTGGMAVTVANLNLTGIHVLLPPTARSGYVLEWDHVNSKIKAYYADYDAVADGALIEVPNSSSLLDAIVARCFYIGY